MPIRRDTTHKPYCLMRFSTKSYLEEVPIIEHQVLTKMEYHEILQILKENNLKGKWYIKLGEKKCKVSDICCEIISRDSKVCKKYLDLILLINSSTSIYEIIVEYATVEYNMPRLPCRIKISDWVNFISNFGLKWYPEKYPYYKFLPEYIKEIEPEKFLYNVRHKEIRQLVAKGFLALEEKEVINLGESKEVISKIANSV